jgi:purine-nucleoside phosphorylase
MTPHIEANYGDYAPIVLLPGDPLRAKWIADTYLTNVKQVSRVRNMLGFTGTYKGKDISVQGGGMGMASNGIYIHELYNIYDVETIIRVGSCGGISKEVKVGDVVVATTAHTDNAMSKKLATHMSPSVTYELLEKYMKFAPKNTKVGPIMSSDWFYNPDQNWWKEHQKLGTLAVEMETHILYALANKFKKKALSVCTVADHFEKGTIIYQDTDIGPVPTTNKDMTPAEREQSFDSMVGSLLESLC